MSSSASNYDIPRLQLGIGLALTAFVIALIAATTVSRNIDCTDLWIGILTLTYGTMMFASSYVEEEHHFWYWVTSGWLGWLHFKLSVYLLQGT